MSTFKEHCETLGLVERHGACACANCELYFTEAMGGCKVHLRWYSRGTEHKTTMTMDRFLNITGEDLAKMAKTYIASSKYVIDTMAKVQDLKREIDTFTLSIDDAETVFKTRLGAILSWSGK